MPKSICGILFLIMMSYSGSVQAQAVETSSPSGGEKLDSTMNNFYRAVLEAELQFSPLLASRLGDHRFDHLLDDLSAPERKLRLESTRRTLERLAQEINYDSLSRQEQVDYEILRDQLQFDLWRNENYNPYERDPRLFTNLATDCVYVLLTQSTLPKETNITNAIARMKLIPQVLAAGRESLKNPARVVTETAIQQNRGAISFFQEELFILIGTSPQLEDAKKAAATVLNALQAHQTFLEQDLLPRANGEWRIGKDLFSEKFIMETGAGLTADQVLAHAESNFAEIQRDMALVSRQLWSHYFPQEPLPPDDEAGRRELIQRVVKEVGYDHSAPNELAHDAEQTVAAIKSFIEQHDILRLPEPDRCLIIEMPEFQRGNSVAFLDAAPPLDTTASSIYAISPPPQSWKTSQIASFLEEYNREMLKILTIHEAYPGHYVQLEYANRHPSLIRRILGSGTYAEGWATYCEPMMLDQGYGDGNLRLRLMQLKFQLRGVANAMLDHRMHCTQIQDDEALRFLMEEAFQSEGEARLKVIRAKQSSCQLSTYFVGRHAFSNLRRDIQREQGADFHLGRFHEAVLSPGSVPVKYLPELVRLRLQQPR